MNTQSTLPRSFAAAVAENADEDNDDEEEDDDEQGGAGAFVGGLGFMALTAAERSGYIAVRWDRIERDCMATLDLDSSGRVDHNDVQQAGHDFVRYMVGKNSGVTAATFTAGLLFGLRKG